MVVDCGGGTVDITVHEVSNKEGHIKEVFKATGGPYGSTSGDTHTHSGTSCLDTLQLEIETKVIRRFPKILQSRRRPLPRSSSS